MIFDPDSSMSLERKAIFYALWNFPTTDSIYIIFSGGTRLRINNKKFIEVIHALTLPDFVFWLYANGFRCTTGRNHQNLIWFDCIWKCWITDIIRNRSGFYRFVGMVYWWVTRLNIANVQYKTLTPFYLLFRFHNNQIPIYERISWSSFYCLRHWRE